MCGLFFASHIVFEPQAREAAHVLASQRRGAGAGAGPPAALRGSIERRVRLFQFLGCEPLADQLILVGSDARDLLLGVVDHGRGEAVEGRVDGADGQRGEGLPPREHLGGRRLVHGVGGAHPLARGKDAAAEEERLDRVTESRQLIDAGLTVPIGHTENVYTPLARARRQRAAVDGDGDDDAADRLDPRDSGWGDD